jgi:hypothetical protein
MVRVAEAGVRVQDIAAVSGHIVEQSQKTRDTYVPRAYRMAQDASRQLEAGVPTGEALAQEPRAGGQLPPGLGSSVLGPTRPSRGSNAARNRVQCDVAISLSGPRFSGGESTGFTSQSGALHAQSRAFPVATQAETTVTACQWAGIAARA